MDAERNSNLRPRIKDKGISEIEWCNIRVSWLPQLFNTLTEGRRVEDVANILEKVAFIIFNYDRAVEFYLARSIKNHYRISEKDVHDILNSTAFFHPYGTVGRLPWQNGNRPVTDFGSAEKRQLLQISYAINTFTEQIEDSVELGNIRNTVDEADQLIFLGFAYHDANLELIQPEKTKDLKRIIGSAYGISEPDCEVIDDSLRHLQLTKKALSQGHGTKILLDRNAKCADIFRKFGRLIRA